MFRAIIVEDEQPNLDLMKVLIGRNPNYAIIGAFTSPLDALANLYKLQPDIIFIDVEMPKMNGLELASHVRQQKQHPEIVFTTAYRDYAPEAFEVSALDYILKPVTPKAIQRVTERLLKCHVAAVPVEQINNALSIRCFGEFKVLTPGGLPVHFQSRRTEELFAYFLCHPGQYISKWKLIDLLWQDVEGERGLSNLHNTLYLLKKVLKDNKIAMSILKLNDGYSLETANEHYDLLLYQRLYQAYDAGKKADGQAEQICSLYQGQLLEGKPYLWKIPLEEAYFRQYTTLTYSLAEAEAAAGNWTGAELRLEKYLSVYPLEEEMIRLLIGMYRRRGEVEKIILAYKQFETACRKELGMEPPPVLRMEWLPNET